MSEEIAKQFAKKQADEVMSLAGGSSPIIRTLVEDTLVEGFLAGVNHATRWRNAKEEMPRLGVRVLVWRRDWKSAEICWHHGNGWLWVRDPYPMPIENGDRWRPITLPGEE